MSEVRDFSEIAPNIAYPEFNFYEFATFVTDSEGQGSEERRVRREGKQHICQRDIVH